jgi:hypothetical protein
MNYQKTFNHILASFFVLAIFFSFAPVANTYAEFDYNSKEAQGDVVKTGVVPCTNECGADDIFRLINNLVDFAVRYLLLPLFVFMIMFAGYKYIMAMGNPGKVANLKGMFGNMLMGLVLFLCAWLIVKGLLYALGYTEGLLFFE